VGLKQHNFSLSDIFQQNLVAKFIYYSLTQQFRNISCKNLCVMLKYQQKS